MDWWKIYEISQFLQSWINWSFHKQNSLSGGFIFHVTLFGQARAANEFWCISKTVKILNMGPVELKLWKIREMTIVWFHEFFITLVKNQTVLDFSLLNFISMFFTYLQEWYFLALSAVPYNISSCTVVVLTNFSCIAVVTTCRYLQCKMTGKFIDSKKDTDIICKHWKEKYETSKFLD